MPLHARPPFLLASVALASVARCFSAASHGVATPRTYQRRLFEELLAAKDAQLADKDARIASAEREMKERVATAERELQARVAAAERELKERVATAERSAAAAESQLRERLAEKDAGMAAQCLASAQALARAKHETDVARGILNVRGLFEACLAEIWRASEIKGTVSTSKKLEALLAGGGCPGLSAYLQLTAVDNGVPEEEVLRQAKSLYDKLSVRLHADAAEGTSRLPIEVLERWGRPTMVALAAFVSFAGRDLSLYNEEGGDLQLRLRLVPSPIPCKATMEELKHLAVGPV